MGERDGSLEGLVNPDPAFWAGKRVLVTGHTGFKGGWLSVWLRELGAQVCGLSLPPVTEPSLFAALDLPGLVQSAFVDIRDAAALGSSIEAFRPEVVLHLAAQALVIEGYENPTETFATNTMGLINLFEAVRRAPDARVIVNVTSDKCYENNAWDYAYRETDALGGSDPYSASKGCAELISNAWRRSYFQKSGQWLATARAGNVIGGGDWSADRLVPDCLRAFARGVSPSIRNPGAIRPWQHVLEPLCGYLLLAERMWNEGEAFSQAWTFGPGDQDSIPVGEMATRLANLWGDGATWTSGAQNLYKEAMMLRVDASRARARLNWRSRLSLQNALSWTVAWHRDFHDGRNPLDLTRSQIRAYCDLEAVA